jgi:hypothetical protein
MSKPRDLSKLFTSNTNITTDVELISTVNSASAYALSEANDYTDNELSSIDLTSTINTASAAAFSSASVYTNSAIASFQALPSQSGNAGKYLSTSGSTTSWQALDLNAAINTASAAAVTYLVDSAPGTLDTLNELSAALNDDPNFYSTIQAVYLTQSSASSSYYTKAEAEKSLLRWSKTYSGSATVISGLDVYANPLEYTPSYINLYINGILQDPSNYTASSGSTVVLDQAVVNNDVVEILSYNTYTVVNDSYTKAESDNKYLSVSASSNYLTSSDAASTYVTQSDATATYLTKTNATSTYLTQSSANSTYLTQSSANSTYLTQSNASSLYITASSASSNYLTQISASTTYAPKASPTFTGDSVFSNLQVTGILDVQEIREKVTNLSIVSASATANFTDGALFFIGSAPSSNFTLNVTNVPNVSSMSQTVSVVVTQGSTGYIPNVFMIGGVSQTIRWLGGVAPTPTSSAGKIDIFNFTIFRTSSSTLIFANSNLNI